MGLGGWVRGILLVASLLGACDAEQSATAVDFWALGREGEVVAQLLPGFTAREPSVRVRLQQIPWSAAHEKLLTAFVGDAMPDVFQVGNTWIPEFVALNALEPLDERLAATPGMPRDDFFAGILDTGVIDSSTYAVPWYVDTRLLFYRTDLLAAVGDREPPRTWNAWLDSMTRIRERRQARDFAILLPVNEWQPLVILALQRGAELLREGDTRGNFQSRPFREAMVFYLDLFRRRLAPLASQADVANLYQDFARGVFTFYVTGPWNLGEFRARLPAALADDWATAPMPAPDDRYPGLSVAGGASLVISRGSARKDAAWRLIEFLNEPAQQAELYRLAGDLPARKQAWSALAADPRADAFRVQLERVRATPKIPEWERIADLITRHAEAAVRGHSSVDEALAALDRDVDDVLAKRRWLLDRERRAS